MLRMRSFVLTADGLGNDHYLVFPSFWNVIEVRPSRVANDEIQVSLSGFRITVRFVSSFISLLAGTWHAR
jgi:hypothetical protein